MTIMHRLGRRPLVARLTAPAGPPAFEVVSRAGTTVVALPCTFGVTYVIETGERLAVVDVGSNADVALIAEFLERTGWPADSVSCILPTHLHFDHILGVDALARRLGARLALGRVAAEQVEGKRPVRHPPWLQLVRAVPTWPMQGLPLPHAGDWGGFLEFYVRPVRPRRFGAPVRCVLEQGSPVPDLAGWTVLETPGHSDEGLCLYHEKARFLITGDTVRNFLGGEWNPLVTDRASYERTKDMLGSLDVDTVFPGHGPILRGRNIVASLRTPWLLCP